MVKTKKTKTDETLKKKHEEVAVVAQDHSMDGSGNDVEVDKMDYEDHEGDKAAVEHSDNAMVITPNGEEKGEGTAVSDNPLAIEDSKRGSLVTRDMILAAAEVVGKTDDASEGNESGPEKSDDDEAMSPTVSSKGTTAKATSKAKAKATPNANAEAKQLKTEGAKNSKGKNSPVEKKKSEAADKKVGKKPNESASDSTKTKAIVPITKGAGEAKTPPKTATKRKAAAKTSPKDEKENDRDTEEEPAVTPATKKRRAASTAPGKKARPAPATYEEADEADKLLWDLRNEGKTWAQIRDAVTEATGVTYGNSTLPNRYDRLKGIFCAVKAEDVTTFLAVKNQVEHQFENEKWAKIAAVMQEEHQLQKYPVQALKNSFKKTGPGVTAKPAPVASPDKASGALVAPAGKDEGEAPASSNEESALSEVDSDAIDRMDVDEKNSASTMSSGGKQGKTTPRKKS